MIAGRTERWTFGYLFDVVLTRDTFMHRMDICRAVGREPELTPEHDGALVADVVAEWAAAARAALPAAAHRSGRRRVVLGHAGRRARGDRTGRRGVLPAAVRPGDGDRTARPGGPLLTCGAGRSPALDAPGLERPRGRSGPGRARRPPAAPSTGRAPAGGRGAPRSAGGGSPTGRCRCRSRSGRAAPRRRRPGRGPDWRAADRAGRHPGGR